MSPFSRRHHAGGAPGGEKRRQVVQVHRQPATRPQGVGDPIQDGAIGGVVEVPKRGGPVDNPVKAARPRYLAHVPGHVFDADPSGGRVGAGPVQEDSRGVKASDPAAAGSQAVGQLPVPASQIQHAHARPQIQQPPGQLRGSRTRDASARDDRAVHGELAAVARRGKEVQIILVIHRCGIEQVTHASEQ